MRKALDGNKTYLVALGIVATGIVEAGALDGVFVFADFWNYLLGGAALGAWRSAHKKLET